MKSEEKNPKNAVSGMNDEAFARQVAGLNNPPTLYSKAADVPYGSEATEHNATHELQDQLAAANKRIKELEQWQQEELIVWGPILDYCQDEANAKRLGIRLGDSISTRVLEILKEIK